MLEIVLRRALAPALAAVILLPSAAVAAPPVGTISELGAPTAGSQNSSLVTGPDGNLWYTRLSGGTIVRLTPDGVATEFPLASVTASPSDITVGPDGALWFTDLDMMSPEIGRITTSGTITEFPLAPMAEPAGIITGPDGSLWFTDYGTDQIGRITTSGAITEFALTSGALPYGITSGPDGNLWFTEYGGNAVGSITTAGTVTEYALPTSAARPTAIAKGADGNLWFSESAAARVGRITPTGTIDEFPVGGAQPQGIAAGPDGNIWFTYLDQAAVGRIEPDGTTDDFPGTSGATGAIGLGPDGQMWFTEQDYDEVGTVYADGPWATLDATSHGFGSVVMGDTANGSFTLTNSGGADLPLSTLTLAGSTDFAWSGSRDVLGLDGPARRRLVRAGADLRAERAGSGVGHADRRRRRGGPAADALADGHRQLSGAVRPDRLGLRHRHRRRHARGHCEPEWRGHERLVRVRRQHRLRRDDDGSGRRRGHVRRGRRRLADRPGRVDDVSLPAGDVERRRHGVRRRRDVHDRGRTAAGHARHAGRAGRAGHARTGHAASAGPHVDGRVGDGQGGHAARPLRPRVHGHRRGAARQDQARQRQFRLAAGKTVSVRLKAKHARGTVTISIAVTGGGSLKVSRKLSAPSRKFVGSRRPNLRLATLARLRGVRRGLPELVDLGRVMAVELARHGPHLDQLVALVAVRAGRAGSEAGRPTARSRA